MNDFLNIFCKDINNVIKYPILEIYIKSQNIFLSKYLIIDSEEELSICDRITYQIIVIYKDTEYLTVSKDVQVLKIKEKKKIFKLGDFELYKKLYVS